MFHLLLSSGDTTAGAEQVAGQGVQNPACGGEKGRPYRQRAAGARVEACVKMCSVDATASILHSFYVEWL